MVTLNKYGDKCNRIYLELYGISTDTKPIEKFGTTYIGNASTYLEMDTGKIFIYDEENHKWYEMQEVYFMDIVTYALSKKIKMYVDSSVSG